MREKRGLSPVIASVLLVSITLILALIIFLWARSFVGEQAVKFDEPVEFSCENVNFDAEVDTSVDKVFVINRGNVPLYGVEVRTRGLGGIQILDTFAGQTISSGETGEVGDDEGKIESIGAGDDVVVVPVILGEVGGETKAFTCEERFGVFANVI